MNEVVINTLTFVYPRTVFYLGNVIKGPGCAGHKELHSMSRIPRLRMDLLIVTDVLVLTRLESEAAPEKSFSVVFCVVPD